MTDSSKYRWPDLAEAASGILGLAEGDCAISASERESSDCQMTARLVVAVAEACADSGVDGDREHAEWPDVKRRTLEAVRDLINAELEEMKS